MRVERRSGKGREKKRDKRAAARDQRSELGFWEFRTDERD